MGRGLHRCLILSLIFFNPLLSSKYLFALNPKTAPTCGSIVLAEGGHNADFLALSPALAQYRRARYIVLQAPYERTTSYMKGTEFGPKAIVEASPQVEFYDMLTDSEPFRRGIFTAAPFDFKAISPRGSLKMIENTVEMTLKDGKFPVLLGGEHTISAAPVRAAVSVFGSVSVLQFDAHTDFRNTYEGSKYNHACVMRRIHESAPNSYSVGIRAQSIAERNYAKNNADRIGILPAKLMASRRKAGQPVFDLQELLRFLPTEKVYITFDLDYFDPSIMPSVGTPVPGGGLWDETLEILAKVFEHKQVIGVDIVELKPDHNEHSNFLAAQLAYQMMALHAQ